MPTPIPERMFEQLIYQLPSEILHNIKEYVLSPQIRLEMLYDKSRLDEAKIKKILTKFTSKQLEQINWRFIYFKIYKTSPPMCDNANLHPIFDMVPNPPIKAIMYEDSPEYTPFKLYNSHGVLRNFKLGYCVTRSDYYSENVKTEKGRKRQQYQNIVNSWRCIHEGNKIGSKIPKIDEYLINIEFELIKFLILTHKNLKI